VTQNTPKEPMRLAGVANWKTPVFKLCFILVTYVSDKEHSFALSKTSLQLEKELRNCGLSYIGQTQKNFKFRLDEHNPLKSNHQATDVVKHSYTYPGHFIEFENPEILASAFDDRELLIKETLLIQEHQPEINVENFSTPSYK